MSTARSLPLAAVVAAIVVSSAIVGADERRPPNIVLIYCDDLGYGDLGCYGQTRWKTPRLDRMASEGARLTDFSTAAAVCSASRAALLTGCYPQRLNILGALGPNSPTGIHPNERLLPEILRDQGYATACVGKWHLGDRKPMLAVQNGFDRYFGLPYSNDMWPKHPEGGRFPPLPLIDQDQVVETMPDQSQLTKRYGDVAVKFIQDNAQRPFFLYVAHSMPHVPLHASKEFEGKSGAGLYGDVVAEIDDSVGRVLDALTEQGLDERTIVVFSSDNGPWLSYGDHAGSSGPLREGKHTSFEGGVRVPCLVRWPGVVPAGRTCDGLAATIDLAPTLARMAGAAMPDDRKIDGVDLGPLLRGETDESPRKSFWCFWNNQLQAVREGKWKLHFPHKYRTIEGAPAVGGKPTKYVDRDIPLSLFDLGSDVGESRDLAKDRPDLVARLEKIAEEAREDLGDELTNRPGKNRRPAGKAE